MKNTLKAYLYNHAVGYKKAKTRHQLMWQLGGIADRTLRRLIEELRADGEPILSRYEDAGYFIPKTREEVNETIAKETHRAQSVFRSVSGIVRGVNKRFLDKKQLKFTMK